MPKRTVPASDLIKLSGSGTVFSVSPTAAALSSAELATGDYIVEGVEEDTVAKKVTATLANGTQVPFGYTPVTIYL